MPPLVSIIIPTYNSAQTLGACLDSILAQKDCVIPDPDRESSEAINFLPFRRGDTEGYTRNIIPDFPTFRPSDVSIEIIVVDNFSKNKTTKIAKKHPVRFFDINDSFIPPLKIRGGAGGVMKYERSAQNNCAWYNN